MKARYTRISTANQKLERQLVKKHPDEQIFIDIISGSVPFTDRPQSSLLINKIRNGDINYVSVSSVDRLGRNLYQILTTLEWFNKNNTTLKIDDLGIESRINGKENQVFKLILSVLGNVAEMERTTLLERQKEGIAIAKARGVYKGRQRGTKMKDDEVLERYKGVVKLLKQGLSIRKTAKLEGVSAGTVMKVKR